MTRRTDRSRPRSIIRVAVGRRTGRPGALGAVRGNGARLTLTQTRPADLADHRVTALAAWRTHLEWLADHLRDRIRPRPEGRAEELARRYAEVIR